MFKFRLKTSTGYFTIGISPDGELVYDKHRAEEALEYETAFAAMGGGDTPLRTFFLNVDRSPVAELHRRLLLKEKTFDDDEMPRKAAMGDIIYVRWFGGLESKAHGVSALLVVDYAEHALAHFKKRHPRARLPRNAVSMVRELLTWMIKHMRIPEIPDEQCDILDKLEHIEIVGIPEYEHLADQQAMDLVYMLCHGWSGYFTDVVLVSERAVWSVARAHSKSQQFEDPEWTPYMDAEKRWQIRRFADVMTALKSGKPWPNIGETP